MNFDLVWHSVQSVLTLFIVSGAGYVISKAGWVNMEIKALLTRLVLVVALPPYMLYNITSFLNRDELFHLAYGLVIPFASISLAFAVALLLAKILKVRPERHGVFCSGFATSNTIFIGLPVNLALFGEVAVPYVLLYYFANTTFFWSVGNYVIAASGSRGNENNSKVRLFSSRTLKQIISPPMLGLFAGVILLLLGWPLPGFIKDSARYMGYLTTPLALIVIGITLQQINLSKIRINRDLAVVLLGRFVISPLTILALCRFLPLPDLMLKVFIIQAGLPVMVNIALLATHYKSDEEFATLAVSVSTLLAIVSIPIMMLLVN